MSTDPTPMTTQLNKAEQILLTSEGHAGLRDGEWGGASLSVRLRSYPAAPPGEDALGVDYVCRLMAEAAAAIDLLTPGVGSLAPAVRAGDGVSCEAVEAASAAFYDTMIGPEREFWPHHEGWAGKNDAFKAKVRGRMRTALEAALPLAPAARAGDGVALADVAAERRRQIEAEGWTPTHDDEHSGGEICNAASAYAMHAGKPLRPYTVPAVWPWNASWWKPSHRRRDLVKAGALILAEIERLDRAALTAASAANGDGA